MTTWVTSDLHLRHGFVAHLRGYSSPLEHDEALAALWRSTVHPRDVVIVLGDAHVGDLAGAMADLAALPGRKRLVVGNHDRCHPMHRRPAMQRRYAQAFETISLHERMRAEGREILLSHMPYDGDHGPDRFAQWRLRDLGVPILHGHTHSTATYSRSACDTPQVHVGLDAWRALVPIEVAAALAQ